MFKKLQNLNLKCLTLVNGFNQHLFFQGETEDGQTIIIKRSGMFLSGAIADCENRAKISLVLLSETITDHVNINWLIKFFNWKVLDDVFDPLG